ncbi:hypothetical protein KP509_33G008300 [Ceratopteris richardii]|nr:hypothetical protein KP509_33G008300 [Ceratopteris richardii]
MISEAIVALQERSGSSQQAIAKTIEAKHQSALTPNFRKTLSVQLKRLSENGQLVKLKNSYKLSSKALKSPKKHAAKGKVEKPAEPTPTKPKDKVSKEAAGASHKKAKITKAAASKNSKARKVVKKGKSKVDGKGASSSKAAKPLVTEKAQSSSKKSATTQKGASKKAKALKPVPAKATKHKASNKKAMEKPAPSKRSTRSSK